MSQNKYKGIEMYFSEEITEKFAQLEQNEKNYRVAAIIDKILLQETENIENPIYVAELGGGAHPDRYHKFFSKLLKEPKGHMDWVDISPYMLKLAEKYLGNKKYRKRKEVIRFIESDILEYLNRLENKKLDLAIMKYTFEYLKDIKSLFELLSKKLKSKGRLIATIDNLRPELKSYSTNGRYLYNGKEFPDNETRLLKDGDSFMIKFFKVSGDHSSGYLEGAEVVKYYHSPEKIKRLAGFLGFDIFLGDWKDFISPERQKGEEISQNILVLTKKI